MKTNSDKTGVSVFLYKSKKFGSSNKWMKMTSERKTSDKIKEQGMSEGGR